MKIKIGIVGFKDVGKAHYSELRRSNKFEVCGIFDEDEQNEYSRVEIYSDFKKFINESMPEAIVICIDEPRLLDAYFECVKYTKNILIASCVCKNSNDLRQMRYTAAANKVNACLCFSDRCNPVITSLKKALLKDEEIYSIELFHTDPLLNKDVINSLCIFDMDIIKFITGSQISSFSYSFLKDKSQKNIDTMHINFKTKSQILVSIINSICVPLPQFNIRVTTNNGVYFADLLTLKLHQLNPNGQINLKVNNEDSELRVFYDEFYEFCQNRYSDNLVSLDDAINIKELFV